MIGNDLVDLRAREAAGKSRNARFVARVFTVREAQLIAASAAPDAALWMLWAAKEAAYKVAKKLRSDAIFAHSRYEVVPDAPELVLEPRAGSSRPGGHVRLRGIAGLGDARFPIEWKSSASFVHCVALDAAGDFSSLRIAIVSHDELDQARYDHELTERELASLSAARPAESLAVRRLARALASEAGLGAVEIVRERIGSTFGPPRLYPRGGAEPLAGWDITLSHDGDLAAAALGRLTTAR